MSEPKTQNTPVEDVVLVVEQTNALTVEDGYREELVATLKPIAAKIPVYEKYVATVQIKDAASAMAAEAERRKIIADCTVAIDALNSFSPDEKGVGLIERLYRLHRAWTSGRGRFAVLEDLAKKLKRKIGDFEAEQARKAEEEQRRLQAEADAAAERERKKLEKKAEQVKTPEKKQQYQEAAAAVSAPVVNVPVFKSGATFQERWAVKNLDQAAFLKAAAENPQLTGYITINQQAMARGKANNPMLEIPGVTFHKVRV